MVVLITGSGLGLCKSAFWGPQITQITLIFIGALLNGDANHWIWFGFIQKCFLGPTDYTDYTDFFESLINVVANH